MRRSHNYNTGETVTPGSYHHSSSHIEEDNTRQENVLSDKVKALKTITIDIGDEVRYQNKMLSGMDDDFDKSGGFLGQTMGRLNAIAKSGSNCYILYVILFGLFVFFILWMLLRFR